ncbi:antibiotic biosynthesis monooxygenase family protein [Micromonospora sp. NPDC048835]|uniref:antibiotic biosynthesis monooxygenase family protein n=1 Tax=Micromonospora sp. NPDC048835 TaxID=3155147 RepID=UPI0033FACF92
MAHIGIDQPVVTMVNVFTVEPANQQKLVDILIEATDAVMSKVDGFVSANIHASLDGTRVVNYAQWKSEEHFTAMLQSPEVHPHFGEVRAIATPERHLYKVVYTEDAHV